MEVSNILKVVALIAEFNETNIDAVIWGESSLEWDCQAMENKNLSFLKGPSFVGAGGGRLYSWKMYLSQLYSSTLYS